MMALETESKTRGPRVWGLEMSGLHAAWWAGKGVQTCHRGMPFSPDPSAEIFLLLPEHLLVIFDIEELVESLVWSVMDATLITIRESDSSRYREVIRRNSNGGVTGIERSYAVVESVHSSAMFTRSLKIAKEWSEASGAKDEILDEDIAGLQLQRISISGHYYRNDREDDQQRLLDWLVAGWGDPDRVIEGMSEPSPGVFTLAGETVPEGVEVIPPLWIGSDADHGDRKILVGPGAIVDSCCSETSSKTPRVLPIREINPPRGRTRKRFLPRRTLYGLFKRLSDMTLAFMALFMLIPLFFLVSILILIDNGMPIFFGHVRQARGGREFRCWKFRTMRRDAESMVADLEALNKADGPQVFIENDPRVTRVGRYLRRFQIDEIPQFWNVLVGDMSLVGPRPSPDRENQYCPAWRELRLSVRPGITGLWQISRTRTPGEDFQEWIKYDIEYVRTASFFGDIRIIIRTVLDLVSRAGDDSES